MRRDLGKSDFVGLIMVLRAQTDIILVVGGDGQIFTIELSFPTIAGPNMVTWETLTIKGSNGRMMGDLFCKEFKFICNEFKGLTQKWIERLSWILL